MMSHSFWESGTWRQLSWVVLALGPLWGYSQAVGSGYSLWRPDRLEGSSEAHSLGYWPEASIPHHMDLSIGLLITWLPPGWVMRDQYERWICLSSKGTYHLFCHIISVTQSTLVECRKGLHKNTNTRRRLPLDHLEANYLTEVVFKINNQLESILLKCLYRTIYR